MESEKFRFDIKKSSAIARCIVKQHKSMLKHPKFGVNFPYRKYEPNAEDFENHKAFMEKITK
jgi:hypothetical protein